VRYQETVAKHYKDKRQQALNVSEGNKLKPLCIGNAIKTCVLLISYEWKIRLNAVISKTHGN